ncbi:MAG: type I-B CRISPR-associated protein Cas7/Csh2 [Deltaproteobacteria bacterium]|nr:MAG: type I-B CRISPR-associated protein Cas7/Csh2 [Deltaproteobacteria bacterium]
MAENNLLSGRREFLFLYDIKMGNPNGDPDENRPRVLPDGTHYVTDVRLKRFARDFLKSQGQDILVDNIEGRTTNLTGRVVHYLKSQHKPKAVGSELVNILLDAFIDARLFGSSFAFKAEDIKAEEEKNKEATESGKGKVKGKGKKGWEPKPEPKTLTGPIQINMGEVLHQAEEVDIHGTSIFASGEEKSQGTFTTYFGLRYALIGFSGVANQHSAKISRLSDNDYELFLKAMWHGVRSSGNTRTKVGQIPHLLISVEYKAGEEFQFGRLHDYISLNGDKPEKEWASPEDYKIDLTKFIERVNAQNGRIEKIRYDRSPDVNIKGDIPGNWTSLDVETLSIKAPGDGS